ncbi:MAG: RelA/SpoT family protein [Ignavibacteria bacterium]
MDTFSLNRFANKVQFNISNELNRIGFFYRIFSRIKDENSIEKKIKLKNYSSTNGKKMTDLIGIRIIAYFADDISLIHSVLRRIPHHHETVKDEHEIDTFKPQRLNLVFNFDEKDSHDIREIIKIPEIDSKYEIQLRTVFSEGWHEVEHDLRYKCKEVWKEHSDLSRILNGIYATLETSEWSMLQLFEDLAYKSYKNNDPVSLLKNKIRLRFKNDEISDELRHILQKYECRNLKKFSRDKLIRKILNSKINIPMNLSNLIFIINHVFLKNDEIKKINKKQSQFIFDEINEFIPS